MYFAVHCCVNLTFFNLMYKSVNEMMGQSLLCGFDLLMIPHVRGYCRRELWLDIVQPACTTLLILFSIGAPYEFVFSVRVSLFVWGLPLVPHIPPPPHFVVVARRCAISALVLTRCKGHWVKRLRILSMLLSSSLCTFHWVME